MSVFICVLLPAEASVKRIDFGEMECEVRIAEFEALMFILLVHLHLSMCTERMHWTYKALCWGKALQVNFRLKILVFCVNTKIMS